MARGNTSEFSDEDDISLADTVEDDQYEVDEILYEDASDGTKKYLVRWQGYDDEACTWEPVDSFTEGAKNIAFDNWRRKQRDVRAGRSRYADVPSIERQMEAFSAARTERRRRRVAKRKRINEKRKQEAQSRKQRPGTAHSVSPKKRGRPSKRATPAKVMLSDSGTEDESPKKRRRQPHTIMQRPPVAPMAPMTPMTIPVEVNARTTLGTLPAASIAATVSAAAPSPRRSSKSPSATKDPAAPDSDQSANTQQRVQANQHHSNDMFVETDSATSPADSTAEARDSPLEDNEKVLSHAEAGAQQAGAHLASEGDDASSRDAPLPTVQPPEGDASDDSLFGAEDTEEKVGEVVAAPGTGVPSSSSQSHVAARRSTSSPFVRGARRSGISMVVDHSQKRKTLKSFDEAMATNSNDKKFRLLKKQHAYHKAGQNERAPDTSNLVFVNPLTGETQDVGPASPTSAETAVQHADSVMSSSSRVRFAEPEQIDSIRSSSSTLLHPDKVGGPARQPDRMIEPMRRPTTGPGSLHTTSLAQQRENASLPGQPSSAQSSVRQVPRDAAWVHRNVTCRTWYRTAGCMFGDACRFAHRECEEIEPKKADTCVSWAATGRCKFPDDVCSYWHAYKDPTTGDFTAGRSAHASPSVSASARNDGRASGTAVGPNSGRWHTPSQVTCRFWYRDNTCEPRTNGACKFAHHRTEFVAAKRRDPCKWWRLHGRCKWTDAQCEFYHCNVDAEGKPEKEKIFQTCPAWKQGTCPFGGDDCQYYHVYWDAPSAVPDDGAPVVQDTTEVQPLFEPVYTSLVMSNSSDQADIAVRLAYDNPEQAQDTLQTSPVRIMSTCTAADLAQYFPSTEVGRLGSIEALPHSKESSRKLESLSNHLYNNGECAVATGADGAILAISPCDDPPGGLTAGKSVRFVVWPQSVAPVNLVRDLSRPTKDATTVEALIGVDLAELLAVGGSVNARRNVFLMFPPHLEAETHLFARYVQEHGSNVYLVSDPDSLHEFFLDSTKRINNQSIGGVILWHASVVNYFQIPRLHFYLHRSSFTHYRVEPQTGHQEAARFTYTPLFTTGKWILITDDLLEQEPLQALEIMRRFSQETFANQKKHSHDRIVLRPNILAFIKELLLRAQKAGKSADKDVYKAITRYLVELEHPYIRSDNDADVDLTWEPLALSVSAEDLPDYEQVWVDKPRKATEQLVQYFVHLTMDNLETARKCYAIMPSAKSGDAHDREDESSDEGGPTFTPRSPFTPRTPGPSESKKTADKDDGPPRLKKWQARFCHIYFMTAEKYINEVLMRRK